MTMSILNLPEDCLSLILSLTTPRDAIRSSAASKCFLSASLSNIVWDNFLPSDIDNIIHRASSPIQLNQFAPKKDLFLHLSQFPLLLDNSTKSFGVDKYNGKKCYMIAPRALSITWGSTPVYWTWNSVPNSRFAECAVLKSVCWLEIKGNISTKLLSQNTTYGVYFVFKINPYFYGLNYVPVKVAVYEVGEDGSPRDAVEITKEYYLMQPYDDDDDDDYCNDVQHFYDYDDDEEEEEEDELEESSPRRKTCKFAEVPVARSDGWMEIEMGRYQVGVNGEGVALEMSLMEIEDGNWKSGLVVNGIDLRPLA